MGGPDAKGVPIHLIHLLCGRSDPAGHSFIDVGDDIGVKALANPVLPDESPRNRPVLNAALFSHCRT